VHIWMQRWAGRQAAGRATLNLNWGVYHARLGREVGAGEVAADRDPARPDVVVLPEQLQAPAPLPAGRVSRPPAGDQPWVAHPTGTPYVMDAYHVQCVPVGALLSYASGTPLLKSAWLHKYAHALLRNLMGSAGRPEYLARYPRCTGRRSEGCATPARSAR